MSTLGAMDAGPPLMLAYAPVERTRPWGMRWALCIVLAMALWDVADQAYIWISYGRQLMEGLGTKTPSGVMATLVRSIARPLVELAVSIVAFNGLRRGFLRSGECAIIWAGVAINALGSLTTLWIVMQPPISGRMDVVLMVVSNAGLLLLPLLLLLTFASIPPNGNGRGAWRVWWATIGCMVLAFLPAIWNWLTSFDDAWNKLCLDLSRYSREGNVTAIRAVGQLGVEAGALGLAGAGVFSLIYKRGTSSIARVSTTLLLAGLALRAGESLYLFGYGTVTGDWSFNNGPPPTYASHGGTLTLPWPGAGGYGGRGLVIAWVRLIFCWFVLFSFAWLCRIAITHPAVTVWLSKERNGAGGAPRPLSRDQIQ